MRLRLLAVLTPIALLGIAVGFFFTLFLHNGPGTQEGTPGTTASGAPQESITLTTVGAVGAGPHPNWVGYLPTTILHVKAYSTVQMTIDQQDGASGVRNPYVALVRGVSVTLPNGTVAQNTVMVKEYNGKQTTYQALDPNDANLGPAHSFTIPDLGVSVPLMAVPNPDGTQTNEITFDFQTPGPGLYRWQCFVPCGAGTLYGNGGPMQTLGYMAGELEVTN